MFNPIFLLKVEALNEILNNEYVTVYLDEIKSAYKASRNELAQALLLKFEKVLENLTLEASSLAEEQAYDRLQDIVEQYVQKTDEHKVKASPRPKTKGLAVKCRYCGEQTKNIDSVCSKCSPHEYECAECGKFFKDIDKYSINVDNPVCPGCLENFEDDDKEEYPASIKKNKKSNSCNERSLSLKEIMEEDDEEEYVEESVEGDGLDDFDEEEISEYNDEESPKGDKKKNMKPSKGKASKGTNEEETNSSRTNIHSEDGIQDFSSLGRVGKVHTGLIPTNLVDKFKPQFPDSKEKYGKPAPTKTPSTVRVKIKR